MKHRLTLLLLAALPWLADAQTVWRCGPDGRAFSDTPCAEGHALAVAATRPSADLAAARALADREMQRAEAQRRERLREEAAQRGNGWVALGPVSADASVKLRRQASRQQPQTKQAKHAQAQAHAQRRSAPAAAETFPATAPASRRAKG